MKKVAALCLTLFLVFALCGCGDSIKLDNQENDMIAEYIAGVMLKYSAENISNYQNLKNEQETENSSQSSNQNQTGGNENATNSQNNGENQSSSQNNGGNGDTIYAPVDDVMGTMAKNLGFEGMSVLYSKYFVGDSYSPDGLFSVPANSGCKVFAFEFAIKNDTGSEAVVNTTSSSVKFKLDIGGNKIIQSSTLLLNDITNLKDVKIAAGASYNAVVIFQVPSSYEQEVSDMNVYVYSSGKEIGTVPGV